MQLDKALAVMKNFAAFASRHVTDDVIAHVAQAVRLYVARIKELTQD